MAENSKIEWTDHTWNPWRGCSEATLPDGSQHPGCDHCYARTMAKRNPTQLGTWGPDGLRVRAADKTFRSPLLWNRRVMKSSGRTERVFVDSMSDFFEDRDDLAPWRRQAFEIIEQSPHLHFIIATKRPQNIRQFWPHDGYTRRVMVPSPYGMQNCDPTPRCLSNVIVLASVSDQKTADVLVPQLLSCRFVNVGLSVEPLIAPLVLKPQ